MQRQKNLEEIKFKTNTNILSRIRIKYEIAIDLHVDYIS